MSLTREDYISGLRAMADWLEVNPAAPVHLFTPHKIRTSALTQDDDKGVAWVVDVADALGVEPVAGDDDLTVTVQVAPGMVYEAGHIFARRMQAWERLMAVGRSPEFAAEVPS